MPSDMLGLIEMAFVFCIALGWGLFELYRLKRPPKRPAPPPTEDDGPYAS